MCGASSLTTLLGITSDQFTTRLHFSFSEFACSDSMGNSYLSQSHLCLQYCCTINIVKLLQLCRVTISVLQLREFCAGPPPACFSICQFDCELFLTWNRWLVQSATRNCHVSFHTLPWRCFHQPVGKKLPLATKYPAGAGEKYKGSKSLQLS